MHRNSRGRINRKLPKDATWTAGVLNAQIEVCFRGQTGTLWSVTVLNAFRPSLILSRRSMAPQSQKLLVLNAFRHHRYFRTLASPTVVKVIVPCSTPFGITDTFADLLQSLEQVLLVLNAFRHHRYFRCVMVLQMEFVAVGAQRLSASQILSQ